ncbi:MAG: hypothetical protein EB038_05230, partial [Cyclobacteriaceae bacterium]|nr:hypothetical protein [Cyclobacteriaceae bacterium]
ILYACFHFFEKKAVKRFPIILAEHSYEPRYKKMGADFTTVLNYPDLPFFAPFAENVNRKTNRIFYMGILLESRGLQQVAEALYILKKQGHLLQFDVVGELYSSLEKQLHALPFWGEVSEQIQFHGRLTLEKGYAISRNAAVGMCIIQPMKNSVGSYPTKMFEYMNQHFGQYPYPAYSIIQGGDGGMEYAMSTLVTGERSLASLVGVMVHELAHSWFHGVLASNESLYPWMDEGFTSYATNLAMSSIFLKSENPHRGSYAGYYRLVASGLEEPMSTHADHYHTNSAYGSAAYSKGAVFLAQLGYVIGEEARDKGMLRYWNTWQFRHPNANDLIRAMEKQSGLELDWYKEYFVYSTKTIDYAVKEVVPTKEGTSITLQRIGLMPMPVDLQITYQDGTKELIYLPLDVMRGGKAEEQGSAARVQTKVWTWTYPQMTIQVSKPVESIKSVEIDPSRRMADISLENNKVEF